MSHTTPVGDGSRRKYDLVLFDWDGTLADSWPWFKRALKEAAPRFHLRELDETEGERLRSMQPREILKALGLRWWRTPSFTRYMRSRMTAELDQIHLFEGTPRLLSRLATGGVALGIVTTSAEGNVRKLLGPSVSDVTHFACDISMFGKASRVKKLVARSGTPPSKVILVGDEIRDLEAARSAGIASGGVAWGYATADSLRSANPAQFFETMDDVAAALAGGGSE